MTTKLDEMKELWNAGKYRAALKMAASWPRLGKHEKAIRSGWAAAYNSGFYRQLGKDPQELYEDGLAAMADKYNLTPAENLSYDPRT